MKYHPSLSFLLVVLLTACNKGQTDFDATGIFEATETTLSAEQNGILLTLAAEEGDMLEQGQQIGLIDTTQLVLKMQQLRATREAFSAQKPDAEKQLAATRQLLAKARQEEQRYRELVADGAAPAKMLDDAHSQVQVLQRQLDAQASSLGTSSHSLDKQVAATNAQLRQLEDQLRKCRLCSPLKGSVIEKYAQQGEYVQTGRPLLKLADTERLFLRAYVTTAQLKDIKLGQTARVFADFGDGERREYEGRVTWISSRSEFTPKTILTDDERADQVYALKVAVSNDGTIKMGMYGEVKF